MADFASESGHWYLPDGSAFYTCKSANGIERPTTLRDARKVGAVPGVTGIIRQAAQVGLEKWKRSKLLLAALTLPRMPNEPEASWLERVEQDWQKEGRDAADRGTAIHGAIERHYRGEAPDPQLWDWVTATRDEIDHKCGHQVWEPERSFADKRGFGGKTDLWSSDWGLDVKGKEGDAWKADTTIYDEHLMQLAAYREGRRTPGARCAIVFVGRDIPSARLVEVKEADLARGWDMFVSLLCFWRAKNNYRP